MSIKTRRLWCDPKFAHDNMPQDLNELKQHIKHLTTITANEDVAKRDPQDLSKQTECPAK